MSRALLQSGDRVRYVKNGKKLHAVVADHIPFPAIDKVPVFKRNERTVTWILRSALRKCP